MKMFDGRCILKPLERLKRRRSSTTPTTEDSLVIQPLERLGYPLLKRYVYNDNDLQFARSHNSFADILLNWTHS